MKFLTSTAVLATAVFGFCLSGTMAKAQVSASNFKLSLEEAKKRIDYFNKNVLPPYRQIAHEIEIDKAPVQEIYRGFRFVGVPRCDLATSELAIQYCRYVGFKKFEASEIKTLKLYIDEAIALGGGPLFQVMQKNGFRLVRTTKGGSLKKTESGNWNVMDGDPGPGFTLVHEAGFAEMPDSYFNSPLYANLSTLHGNKKCSYGASSLLFVGVFALDSGLKYSHSPEFVSMSPYVKQEPLNPLALPDELKAGLDKIQEKAEAEYNECVDGTFKSTDERIKKWNSAVLCRQMSNAKYHNDPLQLEMPDWKYVSNPQGFFARTLTRLITEPETVEKLDSSIVEYVKNALDQELKN